MRTVIAVLEDNRARIAEMQVQLSAHLPTYEIAFFDNANKMISWLHVNLDRVALISLDHDLPILRSPENELTDFGTGRMVTDYLASKPSACPVIIHSSNETFAPGMMRVLQDAQWKCSRVYPFDGEAWINNDWMHQAVKLLATT